MNIKNLAPRHADELRRRFLRSQYEAAGAGIYVPGMRLFIGGTFRHLLNGADASIDPNLMVSQGLTDILSVYFKGGSPTATFYMAPFSNDATPISTWTAANFTSNAGEATSYSESTRVAWTPNAAANAEIGNDGALSVFTISGNINIYGIGLLTVSPKSSTSGKLVAATRFDNPRLNLQAGDKLAVEYVVEAQDGS